MRRVIVRTPHEAPEEPPVWLSAGEQVRVGERHEEWPEFVSVSCAGGGRGWVPARHLSQSHGDAVVVEAYDTTELSTEEGDVLEVVYHDEPSRWMWCRSPGGDEGWVPDQTVEVLRGL
jgi:Variant SH3 domain